MAGMCRIGRASADCGRVADPWGGRTIAFDDRSFALDFLHVVMAGRVPAIHVVRRAENDVDARDGAQS
ncbi:hypothetical protein SSBR45G_69330 [Bradyrhizobium sp. SSBR45G]|nr:hypothetical protein SSBR45G_69330 [Bradyrhizobium sp. SSBR45G]GLH85396.1 hypothetical protein SSBR45R_28560 [Bradyrhizobium sp. SSBR45R]